MVDGRHVCCLLVDERGGGTRMGTEYCSCTLVYCIKESRMFLKIPRCQYNVRLQGVVEMEMESRLLYRMRGRATQRKNIVLLQLQLPLA
jgi:hypothetical protein